MKNKVIRSFKGKKNVQNEGVKYSELLEQFMAPFIEEFKPVEYVEDIFEFAISAWNFGNIKIIIPEGENKGLTDFIKEKNVDGALFDKMIDFKILSSDKY